MIFLDHNITRDQADQLRRWRIHCWQVGHEIGRPEWQDQQEIVRYLRRRRHATFFTRDVGFYRVRFCHPNYCIVVVTVSPLETASAIRRFLQHRAFRTKAARRGRVVKISPTSITWWEVGRNRQQRVLWEDAR